MNVVDRVDNLEGNVVGVEVVCRSLILTGELRVIRIVVAGEEGSARGVNIIEVVVVVSGLFVDGSDSVVHSCTSFHFTIPVDVLLMWYAILSFSLGHNTFVSLTEQATMYRGTFKIHYLAVYYI